MKLVFRISGVMKLWDPSWGLRHWLSKSDYRLVRIEYVFAFQIRYCELRVKQSSEGEAESIIFILALFSFLSDKSFLKIWANHFSLLTFERFKPSLPLFLTIEGKQYLDLFFSLPARFEQLNTAQRLCIFKFLFLYHFDIIFYSLSSCLLPARPLFLIELYNWRKKTFMWERRDLWRGIGMKNALT